MPAELRPEGDGWTCAEHPAYAPSGLTQRHAQNSLAKHNREHHDAATAELEELTEIITAHTGWTYLLAVGVARDIQEAGFVKVPF